LTTSSSDVLPSPQDTQDNSDVGRTVPIRAGRRRWPTVALLLLAAVPALGGLVGLWLERERPYVPFGDHAIFELVVRDLAEHEVLVGAYSRFGWYHPGPLGTYLLGIPYHLAGGAPEAMSAGALLLAGISAVVAVWLVHRRAGVVPAVWTLLVVTASMHALGDGFIRDTWNPHVPVLPFLAGVLLCWTAIQGTSWALPLAVVPMSLAAQLHVGYLPAVGALCAVLTLGLLVRAVKHLRDRKDLDAVGLEDRPRRRPVRWLFAVVAALVVAVVLWLPPIKQQVTQSPGNIEELLEYMQRTPAATVGLSVGLGRVADEFGKLPLYVTDAGVSTGVAAAVGLTMFIVALITAVLRRRGDVLWLGALTLAVAVAGVAAVARIEGDAFAYITQWTTVVGILSWTTVGLSLLPELLLALRRTVARQRSALGHGAVIGAPLLALATAAVVVAAVGAARADPPQTEVTGQVDRLAEAVLADLDRHGMTGDTGAVVRVDFASTTRPEFLGTFMPGPGLVVELARDGVDVQVSDFWIMVFGERYTERADEATYVATIAYADGSSPPPEPWQQVLAVGEEFEVYGGVPPAG
jgi:hypothetical protein